MEVSWDTNPLNPLEFSSVDSIEMAGCLVEMLGGRDNTHVEVSRDAELLASRLHWVERLSTEVS